MGCHNSPGGDAIGFGKNGRGTILYLNQDFAPGTITGKTVSKGNAANMTEDLRILKMEIDACITGLTATEEDRVLLLGFADAELTDAEIQECLEAEPLDSNDNLSLERSHRPVWPIGMMKPEVSDTVRYLSATWSKRWTFSDDDAYCFFLYNLGAGALTTGSTLRILVKLYGVWVK